FEPIGGSGPSVKNCCCSRRITNSRESDSRSSTGGHSNTVVGADVWIAKSAFRVINPQISATIGVTKQALRHGFVAVDARNVSFCRLSRHGQNCSRHHRENAEQGVAGLAHSPLRWNSVGPCVAQGLPDRTRPRRYPA